MQPDKQSNYVVITQSFKGRVITHCDTVDEAWDAIGSMSFGGIYEVYSPTNQPTDEFIPF